MNPVNDFSYQYDRLDNEKLISIVNNSKNFQPLAVETAYLELQRRILPPDKIKQVNENFNIFLRRKIDQQAKAVLILAPTVKRKPVKKQFLSTIRVIKIIALIVLTVHFITLVQGDTMVFKMIADPASYNLSFIFIAVPYFMLPFGGVFFGLRRKVGWVMLTWATTYNGLRQALLFKTLIDIKLNSHQSDAISNDEIVRNSIIISYFLMIALVICLPKMRKKLKISITTMMLTLVAAVAYVVWEVTKIV